MNRRSLAAKSALMDALAERIRKEADRVGPLVPEVSRHDLMLILGRRMRPLQKQRFFIRRRKGGGYVF